MNEVGVMLVFVVFWILPAFFTARIAESKGYSYPLFFFTGVFFSLIGTLVVAVFLPERELRSDAGEDGTSALDERR